MEKQWKAHCLLVPDPALGHINPMFQFSKRLVQHNVKATFVTPRSFWEDITTESNSTYSVDFETISDGFDEGGREAAYRSEVYIESFKKVGSQTLSELLHKLSKNGFPVNCLIYDSYHPWVLDVAKKHGLLCAVFFTQPCSVNSIYFHLHQGTLKIPIRKSKTLLPGLPELTPSELPAFLYLQYGLYSFFWDYLVDHFSCIKKADWVLANTVYELEHEMVDWMRKMFPVRTIGPAVPSMFLDKRIQGDDDYNISMFKPMSNDVCMNWLQDKPKASVVYASFGSIAILSKEQMKELAQGFLNSDTYFLWVVRKSEEAKLPKNIQEIIGEKGLIVTWSPQLKVLSHEAVGCFVTHCGWNSTLEGLSSGVPMIGVPQWSDQTTNMKYIVDVWKVGVKAPMDKRGILRRDTLKHCIKEVMESEKGKEMKNNALKWMNLIKNSIDDGGSSDQNIAEFVADISK